MIRCIYRGYQKELILSLAEKYNKSPTELLFLIAKLLENNSSLITEVAQDAQEKENARRKSRISYKKN